MKVATAARPAWSLCVACLVGLGGYLLLYVLNGTAGLGSLPLPAALTFTLVGALFAVVGALVASRQPDNKVGAPRGIRTPNRQIRSLVLYPLS
jgi:hypothetical protein